MRVSTIASAPRWMYGRGCCITNLIDCGSRCAASNIWVHGEEGVMMMVSQEVRRRGYVGVFCTFVWSGCLLSSRRRKRLAGSVALGQMMLATVKNCLSFVLGVCPDVVLWRLLDGIEYVVGVVYRSQGA